MSEHSGDPRALVEHAIERHGPRLVIASSFSREDVLLIHWAANVRRDVRIFSIDTGRLPEETYRFASAVTASAGVKIEWLAPERRALESLLAADGHYGFRDSLEERKRCCHVRKVEPLERILATADAWMTGQRRDQSVTRAALEPVEATGDRIKYNPLADWTHDDVVHETKRLGLAVHPLYALGYTSIGCAPCTRATRPSEDERAGRWWWELPEHKECGLHRPRQEVRS